MDWAFRRVRHRFIHNEDIPPSGYEVNCEHWEFMGSIESLKAFKCLRRLEVPISCLLGWSLIESAFLHEILPTNLRHLVLRDDLAVWPDNEWSIRELDTSLNCEHDYPLGGNADHGPVLRQLEAFLKQKGLQLETLTIYFPTEAGWTGTDLHELQEYCKMASVKLVVMDEGVKTLNNDLAASHSADGSVNIQVKQWVLHDPRYPGRDLSLAELMQEFGTEGNNKGDGARGTMVWVKNRTCRFDKRE